MNKDEFFTGLQYFYEHIQDRIVVLIWPTIFVLAFLFGTLIFKIIYDRT